MERTISDTYLLIINLSYHNILQSSGMFHVHRWRLGHVHHLCGKKNEVFVRKFAGYSFRGSSLRIPVRKKKIFLARRRMSVDMTVLRPFAREQPFSV